jgi:4'-phosphopantetheinyl transferase
VQIRVIRGHYFRNLNPMPLQKIYTTGTEQAWALWHITENEGELSFASQESCPEDIVNFQKRLEWLAARALIKTLLEEFGLDYYGLRKDEFGKPFLKEHPHQISLTHSFPYVAAQIDRHDPVGIDLEQPKEKLKTIAHRIFNEVELIDAGDDIVKLCLYWSAKEALYKIHGKRNLLFTRHLSILPFKLAPSGSLVGRINLPENEITVRLHYVVNHEYVVVYTGHQNESS